MVKIVSMQGKGKFSKAVIGAVRKVAVKTARLILKNAKLKARAVTKRRKRANPSGRSRVHITTPKGISGRMRRQRGLK